MSRKMPDRLNPRVRKELLDEFWTMIALLETRAEVKNFFKDLLSETEAIMLARRIAIAKMLLQDIGYDQIQKKLGTSAATIASVHRWLQGGFGGYAGSLPKLEKEIARRERVLEERYEATVPLSRAWMRKQYPLHYLLTDIINGAEPSAESQSPRKLRKK
ncbi:MAG: YerC/YecD family TrpR-related protein [bacterium]|nr:YerC/YecD family TrpR-related protein [bacterium]